MSLVNKAELAKVVGCSLPNIDVKVSRGMPYVQKGGLGVSWSFETSEVLAWEKQQAINNAIGDTQQLDIEELRQRKLAAETTIAEIEAARQRGEVIEIDEAAKVVQSDYIVLKQKVLQIPSRISALVIGLTDETQIKELIIDELHQTLRELSADKVYISDSESEATTQTTTEING